MSSRKTPVKAQKTGSKVSKRQKTPVYYGLDYGRAAARLSGKMQFCQMKRTAEPWNNRRQIFCRKPLEKTIKKIICLTTEQKYFNMEE